jgi:hypothetical protein
LIAAPARVRPPSVPVAAQPLEFWPQDAFERQCAAKLRPPAIGPCFAACGFSRPAMLSRASIAPRSKNDDLQSQAQEYFVAAQGHMRGTQQQETHDAKPCYPWSAGDDAGHSCAAWPGKLRRAVVRGVLGRRRYSYENCSMRSFEMCVNEIHGTGGNTVCSPNSRYQPSSIEPSVHAKPSQRQRSS